MHEQLGIVGQSAPEFRFENWLDNVGGELLLGTDAEEGETSL